MLRYACLVLDHDDTVVRSEATVNYPAFLEVLATLRPGRTLTQEEFTRWCSGRGYTAMCTEHFGFSPEEMELQYQQWKAYVMTHIPPCFDGFPALLRRYRQEGGIICVSSHSAVENITRDYQQHFQMLPDQIYSWDLPAEQRKPAPFALLDIMQRYQLGKEDLLMVDDLQTGYQMAHACGVDFACAAWEPRPADIADFLRQHSTYYLIQVAQLESVLFQ